MKKCNKCGKEYDDSWEMCLACNSPLSGEKGEPISDIREDEISLFKEIFQKLKNLMRFSPILLISFGILVFACIYSIDNSSIYIIALFIGITIAYAYFMAKYQGKVAFTSELLYWIMNDDGSKKPNFTLNYVECQKVLHEAEKILSKMSTPGYKIKFAKPSKEELDERKKFSDLLRQIISINIQKIILTGKGVRIALKTWKIAMNI